MKIIDTTGLFVHTATKTKSILVRHASECMDATVASLILLNTLEGAMPLNLDNYICRGEAGEPWQQTPEKLRATYNYAGVADDGWLIFTPKPGNAVEMGFAAVDGYVQGTWGADVEGVGTKLQLVKAGDAICRDPNNHVDQWRVVRKLFDATYDITK